MKFFVSWILLVANVAQAAPAPLCIDLFAGQSARPVTPAPKPKPPVKTPVTKKPVVQDADDAVTDAVYVNGRRLGANEVADALEMGPLQFVKPVELTDVEMKQMATQMRVFLEDPSINEANVQQALYAAKKLYDSKIDALIYNAGQSLSVSIRNMRNRRLKFAQALQTRDTMVASTIYRDLWESYYISRSRLTEYLQGDATTRDTTLVADSRFLLLGLTAGSNKDLNDQVNKIYLNRTPTAQEVLAIYDQIYARTNDEFRYAIWYIDQVLNDPKTTDDTRADIAYILERLSVDAISRKFGLNLLSQSYLDSKAVTQYLAEHRPQILLYALKETRRQQWIFGTALYLSAFAENFVITVARKIPVKWLSSGIEWVVMLNRNAYLLRYHLEKVEAVLTSPPDQQVATMISQLGTLAANPAEQARFLELFARLSEDMTTWNVVKAQVETLAKDHDNYKVILDMMKEADKAMAKYGPLSKFYSASILDYSVALMIRTGPVVAVILNWPAIGHAITGLYYGGQAAVMHGWLLSYDWAAPFLNLPMGQ